MPTYEYLCQSCGARFEAWQKMTDDPIDVCPTCGEHVRRIIFPVGLVFKGSGFYINDTRSATSRAVPAGDPAPGQGSDKTAGEASADAKDAPPSAGKTGTAGSGDTGSSPAQTSAKSSQTTTASTSGSSSGN